MAALSSFVVTRNDRYAHDCSDGAAVTRWRRPEYAYRDRTAWRWAVFVGERYGSKGYLQRNAAHVGEHCLSRQAIL